MSKIETLQSLTTLSGRSRMQREQERDTAACQQVRLKDPGQRQREQERDTAAHQVAHMDPATRMIEQQIDQQR